MPAAYARIRLLDNGNPQGFLSSGSCIGTAPSGTRSTSSAGVGSCKCPAAVALPRHHYRHRCHDHRRGKERPRAEALVAKRPPQEHGDDGVDERVGGDPRRGGDAEKPGVGSQCDQGPEHHQIRQCKTGEQRDLVQSQPGPLATRRAHCQQQGRPHQHLHGGGKPHGGRQARTARIQGSGGPADRGQDDGGHPHGSRLPTPPRQNGPTNSNTPAKPTASPTILRADGLLPPGRTQFMSSIQNGTRAIMTAVSPEGTRCSAHTTPPWPPRNISAPAMPAAPHWDKRGRAAPRARAQT